MQEFWGASKAFFTEKWAYLYRNYGHENFFIMYIVGKLYDNNFNHWNFVFGFPWQQ